MNVEKYLNETLEDHKLHITLIDPDEQTPEEAVEIAKQAKEANTDAILVGGSITDQEELNLTVKSLKENIDLIIILFPGNISGVSKYADALLFMSLLNSTNPYWLTRAQAISAQAVKKMGIETIPMWYLIIEPGWTVGWVGDAKPVPRNKSDLAVAYALAAEFLGMRVIYLEAGSGADSHIPLDFIMKVKKATNLMVIVGGGIRTAEDAREVRDAGADIIITGTVVEETDDAYKKIKELTDAIH